MTDETIEVRKRDRNPVVAQMVARFEGMVAAATKTAEDRKGMIRTLQFELRNLGRRLARYEVEPPVFPLPVMAQIKKLRHFGVQVSDLASIYRTTPARIDRVLADEEIPLILRHPKAPRSAGRAIRV
jgi:hypothetical protein